jgi:hypothetical protein
MNIKPFVVATLFASTALLGAGPAAAASACKGKSESACAADPACGWTKGYTRKDGRQVAPYCRVKGRDKTAAVRPDKTGD